MPQQISLRLDLVDVYGNKLDEKVDVMLRHQVLSENLKASSVASKIISISGLRGAPQGLYRMEIDPPSYQYISQFVNMKASGETKLRIQFPIDPGKVRGVVFPPFADLSDDLRGLLERSGEVLSFEGKQGKALYDALDDIRKAGLLNIAVKAQHTALTGGETVLHLVDQLREVRGDRFFATVPKRLREDTKNSVHEELFHEVSGSLHHPPSGFTSAGSFKTGEHFGNLQLTFFMRENECVADIDIDDAGGFEHVFQVVRNKFSGQPTHPYNIHEILVGHQHLDPGYRFEI